MRIKKTNAKLDKFKHQETEIISLILGKSHSRHLFTYMDGQMRTRIDRNNFMKMGS